MGPPSGIFNISGVCILSTHVRMWRMLIRHRRTRVSESKQTTICENRGGLFHFRTFIQLCDSNFYFARSLMTSDAMISPTTDGTNAVEPGIARRSVHLCSAPGGQMQ